MILWILTYRVCTLSSGNNDDVGLMCISALLVIAENKIDVDYPGFFVLFCSVLCCVELTDI